MTISSETNRIQYSGDDSTTLFSAAIYFLDDSHLKVVLATAAGVETVQTITTHYTVSGSGDLAGGSITMVTPPATGETLTIIRSVPFTQGTDYVENDPFPAETHEQALDKLTMLTQQLDELMDRTLTSSVSSTIADGELPSITADYILRVNSAADGFEAVTAEVAGLALTLPATDGAFLVGDGTDYIEESGSTARTSMGVAIGSDVQAYDATILTTTSTSTLTNKTLDIDNNTLSNVEVDNIKASALSGTDTTLVTGTAGTSGDLSVWDANGDLIDGPTPPTGDIVGHSDSQVLTNKTIDANSNTVIDLPYDVALVAGFSATMVKEDVAVQTYGELVMTRTGEFTGEAGYADTAPTGAVLILDIEKNGTTIYSTKPQFAATSQTLTAGTLKTDGTEDFVSGDRITFKITQIGSTEPGEGIRFTVKAEV